MRECEAGLRRYAGADAGSKYLRILSFGASGDYHTPRVYERTIGDLLDPSRPGSVLEVVNSVTRYVGMDVEGWRVDRLLGMVRGLERDARERENAGGG